MECRVSTSYKSSRTMITRGRREVNLVEHKSQLTLHEPYSSLFVLLCRRRWCTSRSDGRHGYVLYLYSFAYVVRLYLVVLTEWQMNTHRIADPRGGRNRNGRYRINTLKKNQSVNPTVIPELAQKGTSTSLRELQLAVSCT